MPLIGGRGYDSIKKDWFSGGGRDGWTDWFRQVHLFCHDGEWEPSKTKVFFLTSPLAFSTGEQGAGSRPARPHPGHRRSRCWLCTGCLYIHMFSISYTYTMYIVNMLASLFNLYNQSHRCSWATLIVDAAEGCQPSWYCSLVWNMRENQVANHPGSAHINMRETNGSFCFHIFRVTASALKKNAFAANIL